MDTSNTHVAVIGAGPAGLAAIKSLLEEGFQVTCFERRRDVGGIWAFSPCTEWTSATNRTKVQLSKFLLPFSDYPFPDDFPRHPTAVDLQKYYQDYATHFDLIKRIKFGIYVTSIRRADDGKRWNLTLSGLPSSLEDSPRIFDKVIVASGSEGAAVVPLPVAQGVPWFRGPILHGQAYKRPEEFVGMNVMVLGQGNSAADCAVELSSCASKVYWSHRRGAMVFPRMVDGERFDKIASWKITRWGFAIAKRFLKVHRWIFDKIFASLVSKAWGSLDPQWRLDRTPYYATTISGMVINDDLIPSLRSGQVISTHGFRRIVGRRAVELADGTTLDDVDAIISCTGYRNTLEVLASILTYLPLPRSQRLPDLYQGIFPIGYEDSIACLNYAIIMDTAATCREIAAMAVAQVWAGKSKLPSHDEMRRELEQHHKWLSALLLKTNLPIYEGVREPSEWLKFVNETAGTGVYEHFGWTWKGIWFWLREPYLYWLMAWGVHSPHIYRVFETGKRNAWEGAREAVRRVNYLSDVDLGRVKVKT